jgi:carotenoid cleavage dioxygenase
MKLSLMLSPLLWPTTSAWKLPSSFVLPAILRSGNAPAKNSLRTFLEHERLRLKDANFAGTKEEHTLQQLSCEGHIPKDLTGLYVRNGPNAIKDEGHFFLGRGMLHALMLDRGRAVWYRNRYVRKEGGALSGFSNVSLLAFAGRLFSLGEIGPAVQINPTTLETIGKFLFKGQTENFTAHPKTDANGNLFCFGYELNKPPYLTYMQIGPDCKLIKKVPIDLNAPKMVHDFAITEHCVVFMDLPVLFDIKAAITSALGQLIGREQTLPFRWQPSAGARLGVMPKAGTQADLQWFDINPCFIFHTVNAYERGDEIIFDVVRYSKIMTKGSEDFSEPAFLFRYRLNRKTHNVSETQLGKVAIEFPQINPRYIGKAYRYAYCLMTHLEHADDVQQPRAAGLIKYDLQTGMHKKLILSEHQVLSEFSFIAKKHPQAEDDGYLVGYVFDRQTHTSALWIVDARGFSEKPLAKIHLGVRVPNGFHGTWMPDVSHAG